MRTHVIGATSRCFCVLRQLRSIRRSVADTFQGLVVSLIMSRSNYGNASLAGLPVYLLNQLQVVINAGSCLIFSVDRREHTTSLLCQLHWLRVPDQITFQLVTMMFQCINGTGPGYLSSDVRRVADVPGRKYLPSAASSPLPVIIPATRRPSVGLPVYLLSSSLPFRPGTRFPRHQIRHVASCIQTPAANSSFRQGL